MSTQSAKPNIYNRLDQRVARHGKPLFRLIRELTDSIQGMPASTQELEAAVVNSLGRWSSDATQRFQPQTVLAVEHLGLLDELAQSDGEDMANQLEAQLVHTVVKLVARYKESSLVVWHGTVIPAGDVVQANAYSALNQRAMHRGFQVHEDVSKWIDGRREELSRKAAGNNPMEYLQLAEECLGIRPSSSSGEPTRLRRLFSEFLAEVSSSTEPGHAVAIQTALISTVSRSIRHAVKDGESNMAEVAA